MDAKKIQPLDVVEKVKEDVHTTSSNRAGFAGAVETVLRRFRNLAFLAMLIPLVVVCCTCIGLAAAPAIAFFDWMNATSASWPKFLHYTAMGFGVAFGYLIYGLSLIFIVPLMNWIIPWKPKPFRGPWFSLPAIPWYIHNGLTYIARFTFLEFLAPSPLLNLFYRMMGMKIGKGVLINTCNISDPAMITLGDYVTLGGSATVFAHYGQKGYLIIAPVEIGHGSNVGLKASVMGGVTIGTNCTIKPHVVLLPKTKVNDGETI